MYISLKKRRSNSEGKRAGCENPRISLSLAEINDGEIVSRVGGDLIKQACCLSGVSRLVVGNDCDFGRVYHLDLPINCLTGDKISKKAIIEDTKNALGVLLTDLFPKSRLIDFEVRFGNGNVLEGRYSCFDRKEYNAYSRLLNYQVKEDVCLLDEVQ